MPSKHKVNQWSGTEGILRYGEPILTFNRPSYSKSTHQKSYAMWNWQDKTLAVTAWIRYDKLIDTGTTKANALKYLRELFKPTRQMGVVGTECLKSDGAFVCNFQYFAKLDKCPEPEVMIKAFEIYETCWVPMSKAEYERRRIEYYHSNMDAAARNKLFDFD